MECQFHKNFVMGKSDKGCKFGDKCNFSHKLTGGEMKNNTKRDNGRAAGNNPAPATKPKGDVKQNTGNSNNSIADPARVLFNMPIVIDLETPTNHPRLDACERLNIAYTISSRRVHTSVIGHEIDGQVVRPYITKTALATALRHVRLIKPGMRIVKLLDLWGSSRTNGLIGEINKKCRAIHNINYDCIALSSYAPVIDGKDMLRAGTRGRIDNGTPLEAIQKLGPDLIFIQDVQQQSTSQSELFEYSIMGNCPVVITFHLEIGPMGYKGLSGFWVRKENCVYAYPSAVENPYKDTEDFSWVLETNRAVYKGIEFSWCIEPCHGTNVHFMLLSQVPVEADSSIEYSQIFREMEFELTNAERPDIWKSLTKVVTERAGKSTMRGTYHSVVANQVASQLRAASQTEMCDKSIMTKVDNLFDKDPQLQVLKRWEDTLYNDLVAYTASKARSIALHTQVTYTTINRAEAALVATVTDNFRNPGVVDPGRNRIWYWSTTFFMHCLLVSLPGIWNYFSAWYAAIGLFFKSILIRWARAYKITVITYKLEEPPGEYTTSLSKGLELNFLSTFRGVRRWGMMRNPARGYQQTPFPTNLRGVKEEDIKFYNGNTLIGTGLNHTFTVIKDDTSKTSFAFGPSPLPFHYNSHTPQAVMGMMAAILTPVNVSQDKTVLKEVSPKEHALAWLSIAQFDLVPERFKHIVREEIAISREDRVNWINSKETTKKVLYLQALREVEDDPNGFWTSKQAVTVKSKTNEALIKDKERIIVNCCPKVTVMTGPETEIITQRAKGMWNIYDFWMNPIISNGVTVHAVWGSGTTPAERGEFATHCNHLPEASIAIMACGDDVVMALCYEGVKYFLEGDASNWDHSQTAAKVKHVPTGTEFSCGALVVESKYCLRLGMPPQVEEVTKQLNQGKVRFQNPHCRKEFFEVSLLNAPRRQSGEPGTTLRNTIGTLHLYSAVAVEAYRTMVNHGIANHEVHDYLTTYFIQRFAALGHRLKLKVYDTIAKTTFLRGFFIPTDGADEGDYMWYPSPEIFSKLGHSCVDPNTRADYKRLQGKDKEETRKLRCTQHVCDILYAYKDFKDMPILRALFKMARPAMTDQTHEERLIAINLTDKWDRQLNMSDRLVDQDWSYMLDRLELSNEEVAEMETMISSVDWEAGLFLVHEGFEKLSRVYV